MDRIGRYNIVRELGRGAMGVVYHAIDPNIGRPVAIKTIRLGEVTNTQERARLRERLFREARSAGILSHPGIVTIYDVEQQGDLAYIAMEFVDGPTLDALLGGPSAIGREQVFAILGQTAVALDYAHQKGIVHRDIKPANIMIAADGSAKITDFGIAKITASEQFTMTGTIVGTPHYMSPEQVQGQTVDGRADQFSLAVVAYEMLTGEKPFTGEQLTTVVYKIVAEEPPPAQRLNATLNSQIESVLRKGLAKKPDVRYKNCQEFVDALESACGAARNWKPLPRGGGFAEPTLVTARGAELPPPHRRREETGTSTEIRRRHKVGMLPVVFAVLMAAGLVGLIAWQAAPWLGKSAAPQQQSDKETSAPAPPAGTDEKKPSAMGETVPQPAPQSAGETAAAQTPAGESAEAKAPETKAATAARTPEAQGKAAETPAPEPKAKVTAPAVRQEQPAAQPRRAPVSTPRLFAVLVATNPPGATVALDGGTGSDCKSPCSVQAPVGRHRISVTMQGYLVEHREVNVTGTPLEVPLISLRSLGGTLMLTSVPAGAAVYIDGREWKQKTPAQIPLSPGSYNVTVEKDGRRISERVEIQNGSTTYRKIPIGQ